MINTIEKTHCLNQNHCLNHFCFNGIFVVVAVVCLLAAWDGRGRWTQKKEH